LGNISKKKSLGDLENYCLNLLFNKGKEISGKNINLSPEIHLKALDSKIMDF